MALHESALEELGLAPMWVRRGMGQTGAGEVAQAAAALEAVVPDGAALREEVAAPVQVVAQGSAHGAAQGATHSAAHGAVYGAMPARPAARQREDAFEQGTRVATVPPAPAARADDERPFIAAADGASTARSTQSTRATPAAPSDSSAPPDDDFAWFDDLPAHPPTEARTEPAERAEPSLQTLDWDALAERVSACERCRLCEKRTNTVFGVGDRNADWMLIGEAPGENEDRQGEPFVGQAGKLLDNMLRSLTLARDTNVYIANVIKCRPPGNRNPEPDEVARCEPYLQRQVALVKPKLIIALGRFAAQSLLKTDASISSLRGRVHTYEGVPVIVTYHPAYLLRSLPDKAKAWTDLCLARDTWLKAGGAGAAAS
jgi:DNA polymerase